MAFNQAGVPVRIVMREPGQGCRRLLNALARPVLFSLDPETAHRWAIKALRNVPLPPAPPDDPRLAVNSFGLDFPNPLGLAAGFDKNGEVADALLRLGFGFTEVGTVTPLPQPGQSRPRLFRLTRDEAVINRLGFPSQGHAAVHARLALRAQKSGIVGINLGVSRSISPTVTFIFRPWSRPKRLPRNISAAWTICC